MCCKVDPRTDHCRSDFGPSRNRPFLLWYLGLGSLFWLGRNQVRISHRTRLVFANFFASFLSVPLFLSPCVPPAKIFLAVFAASVLRSFFSARSPRFGFFSLGFGFLQAEGSLFSSLPLPSHICLVCLVFGAATLF